MVKLTNTRAVMTGEEMQACLDKTGLNQRAYGDLIGLSDGQIRKRRSGYSGIPLEGAILLRLLNAHPQLLKEAWAFSGLPEGREVAPPGGQYRDPAKLEKAKKAQAKKFFGK